MPAQSVKYSILPGKSLLLQLLLLHRAHNRSAVLARHGVRVVGGGGESLAIHCGGFKEGMVPPPSPPVFV